jgi:TRAP-type transport system small permease protein
MIERVTKGARVLERVLGLAIGMLVVVLLGVVMLQLVDRHFFDVGIHAPDQLVRIGLVWLCFLGFASAVQAGANIRIEFLEHWLGARARVVLAVVFDAATLALCVLLGVKGMLLVEVGAGQQLLGTPFTAALPNTGFVVGIALTGVFVLARLMRHLFGRVAV